jgi:putative ABC transport system ATP-binding protein
MGAIIEARNLTRTYLVGEQAVAALNGISLDVAEGEFVAIMGPSGSGKSTLLNLLGCMDTPTSGDYRLDGENVAALDIDRLAGIRNAKLGFVFQSFHLLPGMTAEENVAVPLVYAGVGRAEQRDRAVRLLERMGLGDRRKHHPAQLSIGQQQRVAIARAMINDPRVILADEPTGSLDRRAGIEIMAQFQRFNDEGRTIVLITHDPAIADFAQRCISILDGIVIDDKAVCQPIGAEELLSGEPRDVLR